MNKLLLWDTNLEVYKPLLKLIWWGLVVYCSKSHHGCVWCIVLQKLCAQCKIHHQWASLTANFFSEEPPICPPTWVSSPKLMMEDRLWWRGDGVLGLEITTPLCNSPSLKITRIYRQSTVCTMSAARVMSQELGPTFISLSKLIGKGVMEKWWWSFQSAKTLWSSLPDSHI